MRIRDDDHSYEGWIRQGELYLSRMKASGFLIPEAQTLWDDYRKYADPVKGKKQPDSMPFHPVNFRGGYKKNVPGYIGEITTAGNIRMLYPDCEIIFPQEEIIQVTLEIDIITNSKDLVSAQAKAVKFSGSHLVIMHSFYSGSATHVSLVDIDDKEMFLVNREELMQLAVDNCHNVSKTQLKAIGVCFDNEKQYGLPSVPV